MTEASLNIRRAANQEAIAPLIELCKAGRLFDVQTWIAEGNPVNAPPPPEKGHRPKTPLEYAIDRGFHSLVQVLLEGGAIQEPAGDDAPIYRALQAKRLDIVQLLVEHDFDPRTVDMHQVFGTWDPKIMDYFIERGAEIRAGQPFAWALCNRIRTALGVYKRHREQMPELQQQADIALRHHCAEGNLKWVSLMLWAGADPFTPGFSHPEEEVDEDDEPWSAVGLAALLGHYEVFSLKPIRAGLPGPNPSEFVRYLTHGKGVEVLKSLLEKGLDPNDQPDGGCSAIEPCLESMSWDYVPSSYGRFWDGHRGARKADTPRAREHIKAIHLLVRHGAKWKPADKKEIESARRSLLKLEPDYTLEFVWIMAKYQACTFETVQELLRTPTIKSHMASHRERLQELLACWE
ncbi:MAG: ankyrin repeat domain-containing protein [Phycisphaeraceae bacterium]